MTSKTKQKGQSLTSKTKQTEVRDACPDMACGVGQVMDMPEDRDRQAQDGGPAAETLSTGYRISSGGFDADVESVAYIAGEDHTSVWFLSAVGTQQSCRTIAARMLKANPENAVLQPNRAAAAAGLIWHFNARRAHDCVTPWTFSVKHLPQSRAWHLVMTPLMALHYRQEPDFLLLAPEYGANGQQPLARLHHLYLDRRTREPLHPSWAGWLWERALRLGEALLLDGTGRPAHLCRPDYNRQSLDISRAIADGELTVNG